MRKPSYLSPSALQLWLKSPEEYYQRYLADHRPPKFAQTKAMAVGSAFDAYVKSYLHLVIFGAGHKDSGAFAFDTIFEAQVESQNRDVARVDGRICLDAYKASGCLADLMLDLTHTLGEPRFEIAVAGTLKGDICSVPLLGKPDIYFLNAEGARVVGDFKVNGFYSQASPMAGYIRCRDGWLGKQSRSHNSMHKDVCLGRHKGVEINTASYLAGDWGLQIATYGWLLGEPVGSDFIAAIDQLACKGSSEIRIAQHRSRIAEDFQQGAWNQYQDLWRRVTSGGIFDEDNDLRCAALEDEARVLWPSDGVVSDEDEWLRATARKEF